jgi:hypothetical protein
VVGIRHRTFGWAMTNGAWTAPAPAAANMAADFPMNLRRVITPSLVDAFGRRACAAARFRARFEASG